MASRSRTIFSSIVRAAIGLGAIAVAVAIFSYLASTRERPVPRPPEEVRPRLVVVEAARVPVRRTFSGFGTAEAEFEADVPAEVPAVVEEVLPGIREGRPVRRGELLLRLDARDFRRQAEIAGETLAELDSQSARLDVEEASARRRADLATQDVALARQELVRTERALAEGAAVEREVERARQALLAAERLEVQVQQDLDVFESRRRSLASQMEIQRASKRLAEQNLARCEIRSPLDGILAAVDAKVGESVSPGRRVARVVNLEAIEVPLMLPASARPWVSIGDTAVLERDAGGGRIWEASIARISPVDDPVSRTFTVYAELVQDPDGGDLLVPGVFVLGRVACGDAEARLVVPRRAVRNGRVTVVEDGRTRPQGVGVEWTFEAEIPRFGLPDTQWVVLDEVLSEGTLLMLDGNRTIAPGTAVRPVAAAESLGVPAAVADLATPAAGAVSP
jgi:multidrug efflux pump subunit AcrA (membrane-fusion protein)